MLATTANWSICHCVNPPEDTLWESLFKNWSSLTSVLKIKWIQWKERLIQLKFFFVTSFNSCFATWCLDLWSSTTSHHVCIQMYVFCHYHVLFSTSFQSQIYCPSGHPLNVMMRTTKLVYQVGAIITQNFMRKLLSVSLYIIFKYVRNLPSCLKSFYDKTRRYYWGLW